MKTKKVRPKSLYEIAWEANKLYLTYFRSPIILSWEGFYKEYPEAAASFRQVVESVAREVYRRMRKKEKV